MTSFCKVRSEFQKDFKVSVIGAGNVGATAAYTMLLSGIPTEIALIDIDKEKAEGIVMDFQHSLSFLSYAQLSGGNDFTLCKDSDLVVVTAGARQQEGETRLQLIDKNRKIFQSIIPQIVQAAPNAILLIVTNPVDILTLEAQKISGLPAGRVFGSGTFLDTARLRYHISQQLCLSPKSIEAFVLGEHGDTSFPVFSSANIAGKSLFDFPGFTQKVADQCYFDTKNAAYKIIHDVGYTCYSIGMVIREIMLAIYQHARVVLPLSVPLQGKYGYSGVALSVPAVLDSSGIADVIEVPLSQHEKELFDLSVRTLQEYST